MEQFGDWIMNQTPFAGLDDELLPETPPALLAKRPTYHDLKLALRRIRELEAELACARGALRPSLEVLQRMANGIEPFDRGRFACAVAALPHETPKLSASVAIVNRDLSIASRLEARSLRVIEGGEPPQAVPPPAAPGPA